MPELEILCAKMAKNWGSNEATSIQTEPTLWFYRMLIPILVEETSPRACARHPVQGASLGDLRSNKLCPHEQTHHYLHGGNRVRCSWRRNLIVTSDELAPLGRGETVYWNAENGTAWWGIYPINKTSTFVEWCTLQVKCKKASTYQSCPAGQAFLLYS